MSLKGNRISSVRAIISNKTEASGQFRDKKSVEVRIHLSSCAHDVFSCEAHNAGKL